MSAAGNQDWRATTSAALEPGIKIPTVLWAETPDHNGRSRLAVVQNRNASVARSRRRSCLHCSQPLPAQTRTDARYCSTACRAAHWHRRARLADRLARKRRCQSCRKAIPLTMRAGVQYCSPRCRQRSYREREAEATKPRKAHQRLVKERLAADAPQGAPLDIGRAQVRPISLTEAKALIEPYEWLGTMPAVSRYAFGILFDGRLGGAVVYGDEYGENLGVWDRYGYRGRIIALQRGACAHWAHPHSASKLIRRSMRLLPDRYKAVTATVDGAAGEVGIIYQACGFDYVGTMCAGGRALVSVNGKRISERQAGRLTGTRGARALARLGFNVMPTRHRPCRYFAFRGNRTEQRHLRAEILHLIKPYPTRSAVALVQQERS
jgi:hypothetical protein